MLKNHTPDPSTNAKFQPRFVTSWEGPYCVTEAINRQAIRISDGRSSKQVSVDNVKKYNHAGLWNNPQTQEKRPKKVGRPRSQPTVTATNRVRRHDPWDDSDSESDSGHVTQAWNHEWNIMDDLPVGELTTEMAQSTFFPEGQHSADFTQDIQTAADTPRSGSQASLRLSSTSSLENDAQELPMRGPDPIGISQASTPTHQPRGV